MKAGIEDVYAGVCQMSLKDFNATYCPHCGGRIDFLQQDYRLEECPLCKGPIAYDEAGGKIKGIHKGIAVLLLILILAAFAFIIYLWGER